MPVEWLYVLEDGSYATAASATGDEVSVPAATKDNPVVGRIAFWADDESCKVNINTAQRQVMFGLLMAYADGLNTDAYVEPFLDEINDPVHQ